MIKRERPKRSPLAVTIPFTEAARERFEDAMERGHNVKGQWVAAAIAEKLDRDDPPRDAA